MSKQVTTTVTVSCSGDGINSTTQEQVVNANGVNAGPFPLALTSGFNNVAIPTGAVGFSVIPPSNSAVAKTLKGVTGDTGVSISMTNPTGPIYFNTALANVGITVGSNETVSWIWH